MIDGKILQDEKLDDEELEKVSGGSADNSKLFNEMQKMLDKLGDPEMVKKILEMLNKTNSNT